MSPTPTERLHRNLEDRDSGCIEWTGRTLPRGYGAVYVDGKQVLTHRLAWTLANGPIPDGLHVLHHCDNPPCCNVEHLFLGTNADNAADRDAKGRAGVNAQAAKTHCIHGHEYTEANTMRQRNGRSCRECARLYSIARHARDRAAKVLTA